MSHKIIINLKIELSIQPILNNQKMSLDHYIPRCHGGTDDAENLLPAHAICNSIKNDMMPNNFEQKKKELYQNALENWHIKRKDKMILEKALRHMR